MSGNPDYVWSANTAVDTSMEDKKDAKKNPWSRYRWLALVIVLMLVPAIVLTTIIVIRSKESAVPVANNSTNSSQKHNISIKGLLTIKTAPQANVCGINETIEDCVLVYNAKIIMSALMLLPTSTNSSVSNNISKENHVDCKALKIRRNQLTQIFETRTLKTIYTLSGVPYSSANGSADSNSSLGTQTRSQIDARAGQSTWSLPINYYISTTTGFTASMIANIYTAISNLQSNTCLTFNELSAITSTTDKSYIAFQRDDQYGCSSPVGYDRTDPTSVILIASYCGSIISSIMHEIGHSLGYIHTQSRTDRNSYVRVVTENIIQDYAANFFIWSYGTLTFPDVVFPYDFGSFMHYDAYAFTQNNLATIVPHDRRYERTMGQREKAAFYDYKQINRLYCTRTDCLQMFSNNGCQNNGYLDPRTCSRCICPEGFSGTYCDQRDSSSNCGDTIINATPYSPTQITIQSPIPTSTIPTQQYCVYLIRSLTPGKIRLQLNSINTLTRWVCSTTSLLEVKYETDLALTGARWCGNTVTDAWSNVTAQTNTMVVIFRANNSIKITTGGAQASFQATIFFDAEPTLVLNPTAITTTISTTVSSTTSTIRMTTTLTTSTAPVSTCPPSSFRCQLSSQPTCGGCQNYLPCTIQGTQQCTAFIYQAQLTGCDTIINGYAQCQYRFVQTSYTTNCQRTVLLCCPSYQLILFQTHYFCVYNSQATNLPAQWSLIL